MNLQRPLAMLRKEFLHILRDPRSLSLALAMPVLLLLLFSYALSLDVDQVPTYIIDHDQSSDSRSLIAQFAGSRYYQILGQAESYARIEESIGLNECLLAVVIPQGFARDLAARRPQAVQLLLDGTDSNTASIARGYAESTVTAWASDRLRVRPPVEARVRVWYNSSLESRNFIVPGLISVILMIIAALLTSLTVAREWETGTLEQLLSTPLRSSEIILGKLGAFFILGAADAVIALVTGVFVFDVPFRGCLLFLGFSTAVFLIGAFSWGLFLSSIAESQLQAFQLGMLSSFLPAFLLSGFIYAIENMPAVIQAVTYIFPSRYFISILKASFLKGLGFADLWPQLGALMLYALLVSVLAMRRMRTKVA
jgi:ABC-2 type transport system permease protein